MVASLLPLNLSCEALVVGAGPAGIAAAQELVASGVKTVLIDRHSKPGKKACAGALTKEAWGPAGIDLLAQSSDTQTFDKLVVKTAMGSFALRPGGPLLATIDRAAWTRKKLESLQNAGLKVLLGERLLSFAGSAAELSSGTCGFDFLVAADGAVSKVRRKLGIDTSPSMRAWQIRIDSTSAKQVGLDVETPAVWFSPRRARSGYCWSFPFRGEVRVGMGASSIALDSKSLKRSFFSWLDELGLNRGSGRIQSGTIGCDYVGHRFGRIFLAGDAAGLASPLTGEGISQALISGREVAKEIIEHGYRSRVISNLAGRHRRTHDFLLNRLLLGPLYLLAPQILRVPFIRSKALSRYVK